jgi:hypothetical protein
LVLSPLLSALVEREEQVVKQDLAESLHASAITFRRVEAERVDSRATLETTVEAEVVVRVTTTRPPSLVAQGYLV